MAGQLSNTAVGIQDGTGTRALTTLSINTRARSPQGKVNLVSDVVMFPPICPGVGRIGQWIAGSPRVRVMGVPVIDSSSVGTIYGVYLGAPFVAPTPYSPMTVAQGDPRARLG